MVYRRVVLLGDRRWARRKKGDAGECAEEGHRLGLKTASYVIIILASTYCPTYLIVKLYLEPVHDFPAAPTMALFSVFEGFALVAIGGTFLGRFEREFSGRLGVERRPGSTHFVAGPYDIQYKARPMLEIALVIAGILLAVMGIIVIPIYYGL